jgi:hypothetical protein
MAIVPPGATFDTGERAQVYAEADKPPQPPPTLPPYVELEFVAPVGSDTLAVSWRLTLPASPSIRRSGR